MKVIVIILALSFLATVAQAATLDSEDAVSKLVDQAMAKIGSGDLEGGLLLLKPYVAIPDSEFNVMLEQAKLQMPFLQGRIGKSLGAEFINERAVGRSLFQIVYLQKFEKHAIRWRFLFYGVNGKWTLNAFNFDDKIQLLFG